MAEIPENGKIWFDGEIIDWRKATVHVLAHVVHYGSSVFEGLRCYKTKQGAAIFRLHDHIKRLFNSAKIYRIPIPYSQEELEQACIDIVKANHLEEAYLRPIVFRGYKTLGVDPKDSPVQVKSNETGSANIDGNNVIDKSDLQREGKQELIFNEEIKVKGRIEKPGVLYLIPQKNEKFQLDMDIPDFGKEVSWLQYSTVVPNADKLDGDGNISAGVNLERLTPGEEKGSGDGSLAGALSRKLKGH